MASIKALFFMIVLSVCPCYIVSQLPSTCDGTTRFQGPMREGYMRIDGNVASTIPNTRSLLDCISSCADTAGCTSVNFAQTSRDCELLDDQTILTEDDFVVNDETTFYWLIRKLFSFCTLNS